MHLPTNLSFNTMQDFIAEIGKSVHNWGSIVNNLNLFEIFVASDFAPQYGPVHIPDSAWELGLTELLVRYFSTVSLGKDKKMFEIFVFTQAQYPTMEKKKRNRRCYDLPGHSKPLSGGWD